MLLDVVIAGVESEGQSSNFLKRDISLILSKSHAILSL